MSCPTHETLIGYAAGDLDTPERQSVATHIATNCPACTAELETIASMRATARSGVLEFPSLSTFEQAARIPADLKEQTIAARIGHIASLVFDTVRTPIPQGARSSAASSRQLLFRALDYDIDVRIADRASDSVRVSGQILPGPERPIEAVSGVDIALIRHGRAVGYCSTSNLGEFDFGSVPCGDYTLSVETEEERILVERLTAHHH